MRLDQMRRLRVLPAESCRCERNEEPLFYCFRMLSTTLLQLGMPTKRLENAQAILPSPRPCPHVRKFCSPSKTDC